MNCSSCGANLPMGARVCPACGAPTAYDAGSPPYQSSVPPSPYGVPPQQGREGYDPNAPTYISSPAGTPASWQPPPATNYGSQPYDSNPYSAASNPYAPSDPYNVPAPQQAPVYPGGFPPPKRRNRIGLIIGIIALVLVLACGGIIAVFALATRSAVTSATATLTPIVPTPTPASPSGSPIVPSAAAILANPKMASAIDNNYNPTALTNNFTVNQKAFVTFTINTGGQSGYARAKWYINGKLDFTNSIIAIQSSFDHGFFRDILGTAGNGVVELYWCTKSDCSDEQLAAVATFTVQSS